MFINVGEGIPAFFEDLYYGAVDKAYELIHPECREGAKKQVTESTGKEKEEESVRMV